MSPRGSSRTPWPLGLVLALVGCAPDAAQPVADGIDDDFADGAGKADGAAALDPAEVAGVLTAANTLDETQLDDDVGLDRRAAAAIVARRLTDGEFATLDALDAVPWVGPAALARLLAYAWAHDLVDDGDTAPCLIISEYAEGSGNYNKAIEIWNCGEAPVALGERSLCLVRNDDSDCTVTNHFADVVLDAGDTWVVCRNQGGTFNDPMQSLRDRCDQQMPGVALHSGDDRFAVLDVDGTVLDAFGRFSWRPATEIWANVVLRRCDLRPYLGTTFFTTAGQYTTHSRHAHDQLGVAPVAGCE